MTQTSVSSDQVVPETTAPARSQYLHGDSLVFDALEEYSNKSGHRAEVREKRALDLLIQVASFTDCVEESIIYSENERVFCTNLDEDDMTLEFFMGANSDQDFFMIYAYKGLPNPRPIRSLYDLGQALDETGQMATEVLLAFRKSVLEASPALGR